MSAYTEKAREIADKVFEASRNTSGSYEDFREDAAPIIAAAIEAAVAAAREALPCPFCGKEPEIRQVYVPDNWHPWEVRCRTIASDCAVLPSVRHTNRAEAIALWNTGPLPSETLRVAREALAPFDAVVDGIAAAIEAAVAEEREACAKGEV